MPAKRGNTDPKPLAPSCEIRTDDLTRQLYATDASIYQIVPAAVAFPRSSHQAVAAIQFASQAGWSVIPRGAGTGLAGGAVGDGLVIDFARYNRRISEFNREARTVRVEPGVVLDQLNGYLRPAGLWFGPDVATSARATLGGMIANNSSGSQVPAYGTTIDHVLSLEIILADGTIAEVSSTSHHFPHLQQAVDELVARHRAAIDEHMPAGHLLKRWPGYSFDHALRQPGDLTRVLIGSEGTLAGIWSATLKLVPVPSEIGMAAIFFDTVAEAMQSTVELLDLAPASIEHIDDVLFNQTKGQLAFATARALMGLDEQPCKSILLVKFFDHVQDKLDAVVKRKLGRRTAIFMDRSSQEMVTMVRKAGLSLVTACPGPAKPTPGLEDIAVPPDRLPHYVTALRTLFESHSIECSYYGHASSGLLHVRPKLNLHTAEDIRRYRECAKDVFAITRQFKGSIAGEHGVGIARTEFLPEQIGDELAGASRELKKLFDPDNLFNPGKIVGDGRYRIDTHLRQGAGYEIRLPFEPRMHFVDRDGSFVGNLEQCNGCGGCRKDMPTMCPTYIATGEEAMSTRGRTNIIRATLDGRLTNAADLNAALSNCLSCKACKRECPSNVDLTQLKADLLHAKHQQHGIPLLDHLIAHADWLGRIGSATAPLSNHVMNWRLTRAVLQWFGFADRPLPSWSPIRFDRWFARQPVVPGSRGTVLLWDDTWVRYHEPHIGQAAVRVLQAAGLTVQLPIGHKCCGRPACSRGLLDEVMRLGRHNLALLGQTDPSIPIIFLEPSCRSMFVDEYRQMKIPGADAIAPRCVLFEQFMHDLLSRQADALSWRDGEPIRVAIHGHCHVKALTDPQVLPRLARFIPHAEVQLLDTGCCGMAGAFGMLKDKYELSVAVAQDLLNKLNALPPQTMLIASGTSCRHQITHLSSFKPLHMAELLAASLR